MLSKLNPVAEEFVPPSLSNNYNGGPLLLPPSDAAHFSYSVDFLLQTAGTMLGYYPIRVLPSKTAIAPVNRSSNLTKASLVFVMNSGFSMVESAASLRGETFLKQHTCMGVNFCSFKLALMNPIMYFLGSRVHPEHLRHFWGIYEGLDGLCNNFANQPSVCVA